MRRFLFECQSFEPNVPAVCTPAPGPEQALLDLVNSYRVSARPCGTWLPPDPSAPELALAGLDHLDATPLPPLDKALIQNALLQLAACGNATGAAQKPHTYAKHARALLPKFTLTAEETASLPTSADVLGPWPGDPTAWFDGHDPQQFHNRSDGFARAHRQIMKQNTLGDVVRLVLVDKAGAPFVSDVVQRVVLRRLDSDGAIHACFAELASPASGCEPTLHPLTEERGTSVLGGYKFTTVPCNGCHTANMPKATPYGPNSGFAVDEGTRKRIQAELKPILSR